MGKEMMLSIITVNYNHRGGLEKTLKSVFSQFYRDFEYIVVDGGSSDGSKQLISQLYENAYPNPNSTIIFQWVSEPDKGTYDAMNKGLTMATGEYVLFLNSGDILASNHVLSDVFSQEHCADLIVGRQYQMRGHRKCTAHRIAAEEVNKQFLISNTLPHQATFIRRELLLQSGGYDLSYNIVADWVFWYDAIVNHNATVSCIPEFISVMEEEGLSKDINQCRAEMAKYLHGQSSECSEQDWMDRIQDNANSFVLNRAQRTLLGKLLLKIAVQLGK